MAYIDDGKCRNQGQIQEPCCISDESPLQLSAVTDCCKELHLLKVTSASKQ